MPQLRDVLQDPKAFNLSYALFADKSSLSLDSDVLVLDADDVEEGEEDPAEARAAGYDYVLMMNDVHGIISNLLAQQRQPTDELRLDALRFYLARDAYIEV